ncbi:P27 family phage terminase small subunit [Gordonia sp. NPDC003422]
MTDVKPPRCPSSLAKAGRTLWRTITQQVADDGLMLDARELEVLRQACATADDLARIEQVLGSVDNLVVKGSQGQPVSHPMLSEARACRSQIASLVARLDLDVSAAAVLPKVKGPRSVQARRAANVRWQGRGA